MPGDGQDIDAAQAELRQLGVTSFGVDDARAVGRAASGKLTAIPELCGKCGDGRAAIGPDGDFVPCVLGRARIAGNVKAQSIADILDGDLWATIMESIPNRGGCITCTPADSNDCNPARVS